MLPDKDGASTEDPDLVAERIIASVRFLSESAEGSDLVYLARPLKQCLAICERAYLKDKRRRFSRGENGKGRHGK